MKDQNNTLESKFVDDSGRESTIYIEPNGTSNINTLPKGKYKIVENIKSNTNKYLAKKRKAKGILTMDIGVNSEGFAPLATLAVIAAISILLVLYILFRF